MFAFFSVLHRLKGDPRMAGRARGVGAAAKDPVRRPATAAPAITALDGLIMITFLFVFCVFVFLHQGAATRETLRVEDFPVSLARPHSQSKLFCLYPCLADLLTLNRFWFPPLTSKVVRPESGSRLKTS